VTTENVQDVLAQFFFNGMVYKRQAIASVIQKLTVLTGIMETNQQFRFYSTSLLILYEGRETLPADSECCADVKLIDFAHTFPLEKDSHKPIDDGFLVGLRNLLNILQRIYVERN